MHSFLPDDEPWVIKQESLARLYNAHDWLPQANQMSISLYLMSPNETAVKTWLSSKPKVEKVQESSSQASGNYHHESFLTPSFAYLCLLLWQPSSDLIARCGSLISGSHLSP